jgi:hypothetical protein
MSVTARWIVGIAGLPFAVTGLVPFTGSARQWTALALGAIVGGFGLAEAIRVVVCGLTQTGIGHLWLNLLTGLVIVALTLFVHEPERRPA